MDIGLVIYSWSGHTLSVAEKLKERLADRGHAATVVPVKVVGEREQGARNFELDSLPELGGFDGLVFGAAVEAFSLSPVLKAYLKQVETLQGKKVACLVTQQFPYAWLGGSRAARQITKLCKAKGATIVGSAVAHWTQSKREASVAAAVDRLAGLF
jgi:menaquinone-dependent protoporphyrinogen IX oxidase